MKGFFGMPITVEPLAQSNGAEPVLVYRFSGRVTLADLENLRAQEAPFFSELAPNECLKIMLDFSELYTIPAELFAPLQHTRLVRDRRVCIVSVVGANPYLRALAISLGLIAARHNFVFSATREDALQTLQRYPTANCA